MLNFLAVAIMSHGQSDAVFDLAKTLVGGSWEGQAAPGVKLSFQYKLEQDGTLIVGTGAIDDGKKRVPVRASLGWDPVAKQVYYLDQHGSDTVYFGHIAKRGDTLLFDFNGLSGDQGHYRIEMRLGVVLPITSFFHGSSIAELAKQIRNMR